MTRRRGGEKREGIGLVGVDTVPVPDVTIPEPNAPSSFPFRRVSDVVAMVIFLATFVGFVWFVHKNAVNVVFDDQWLDINLIKHADSGTLSWSLLWAQHNENRVLFPNLIVLLLAATTHFNIVVEQYLSGLLLMATTALLILAHKRRSPSIPWIFYCPVALAMASFTSLGPALFGFLLSWYLVLFGMALALFLLDRPTLSRWALAGAIAAAVLGSFSSLQGLIIWPSGLVLLYLRQRSGRATLAWMASAVVTTGAYLYHFNFAATGGSESSTLSHPMEAIRFFFSSIGNVFGTDIANTPTAVNDRAFAVGVVVFVVAIWALCRGFRADRNDGGPIGVALICYGLFFVAFITLGRTQLGLFSEARFSVFALILWIGTYLTLLEPRSPMLDGTREIWLARFDRLARIKASPDGPVPATPTAGHLGWSQGVTLVMQVGLIGLILIQLVIGGNGAIANANGWRSHQTEVGDVTANINDASNSLISQVLGEYPPAFERQLAVFARSKDLSLFDTPLATELERQGLFPQYRVGVVYPKNGATVSGRTLLDASQDVGRDVTSVALRITGNGLPHPVVLPTTRSLAGQYAYWDTRQVPNGGYEVYAVVARPGRANVVSNPIDVLVANH
jgi:hypothetical protein